MYCVIRIYKNFDPAPIVIIWKSNVSNYLKSAAVKIYKNQLFL